MGFLALICVWSVVVWIVLEVTGKFVTGLPWFLKVPVVLFWAAVTGLGLWLVLTLLSGDFNFGGRYGGRMD